MHLRDHPQRYTGTTRNTIRAIIMTLWRFTGILPHLILQGECLIRRRQLGQSCLTTEPPGFQPPLKRRPVVQRGTAILGLYLPPLHIPLHGPLPG